MKMLGQAVAKYLTEGELDVSTNFENSTKIADIAIFQTRSVIHSLQLAFDYVLYICVVQL